MLLYRRGLFRCDGRMEHEIYTWTDQTDPLPVCCVEERAEPKGKLNRFLSVPSLTCGHELRAATKRRRSQIETADVISLCRLAGPSLRNSK